MKKTAILLMLITIVSKIIGFIRDIILAYFYGASDISDVYLIAITIPLVLIGFISSGISTGYIPMYSKIEKDSGFLEGNRFTNNLVNIMFILSTMVIIFGFIFTEQLVKLFASGFNGETLTLAILFTRVSLFGVYFTGLIYIYNGFLQVKGNFIIPALIGFPMNVIVILSIYLSSNTTSLILVIGTVLATASQLFLLLPFLFKKGYRYKFFLDVKNKYIKNMIYIALPVIIGVSVDQINVLVDRTIASQIAIGGISALNYANRMNLFVQGIFVVSISTVMYPLISRMAVDGNMNGLKKSVSEAISGINILVIPASIGAMIFSQQIVQLLFGRGAFDNQAIAMTSNALFFYSIGMLGFGLREVLSRAFYSLQDTRTPMIIASVAVAMNIVLNIILSKFLGIGGLALATSISAIVGAILLFISLRRKIGPLGMKNIIITFFKTSFAVLIMGIISKSTFDFLFSHLPQNFSLIASIGVGVVIYFITIYFMKIKEVETILNALKIRFKNTSSI